LGLVLSRVLFWCQAIFSWSLGWPLVSRLWSIQIFVAAIDTATGAGWNASQYAGRQAETKDSRHGLILAGGKKKASRPDKNPKAARCLFSMFEAITDYLAGAVGAVGAGALAGVVGLVSLQPTQTARKPASITNERIFFTAIHPLKQE
jgi:hypothetical protein